MRDIDLAYDFIEENIPDVYSKAFREHDEDASKQFHELVHKLINEDRDMLFEWGEEKAKQYANSDKGKEAAAALERARERYLKTKQ